MSIRMKDILHKPTPLPCIHSLTLRCLWSWRSLELEFLLIALQKCVLHSDVHAHCLGWGPPSARILKNKYCFVEMLDGLAKPQHMVGNLIYPEWDPQSSQVKLCWFGGLLKHFSYYVKPYLCLHEFDVYGQVWKLDKRLWYGTAFTPLSFHVLISVENLSFSDMLPKGFVLSFASLCDCMIGTIAAAVRVNFEKQRWPTTITPLTIQTGCDLVTYQHIV